ncbi:hypothetical protein Ais01nite_00930 [Asanoa ishikariensis]|uniref:Uncharacterized protein n=1 Tax=Asanoa ishikariensis TaxID=137265 RepID=A0A1H3TQK9_9ACTN|nr:hypothetical protein [Asanoa ishikariensis]GIF62058.1 hypothetical protein Ais01nite_00930 [Asanoa ishikariensis]SDZ51935.1 hypothetical protein SAMN05421684_6129 [Asanoa ishikariensis]
MSTLTIECAEPDSASLYEWLRNEDALRGAVVRQAEPARPETLGALSTILVDVLAPGAVAALAGSLSVWFTQRRSDVKITIRSRRGTISLDAKRVPDAERLLRSVVEAVEPDEP